MENHQQTTNNNLINFNTDLQIFIKSENPDFNILISLFQKETDLPSLIEHKSILIKILELMQNKLELDKMYQLLKIFTTYNSSNFNLIEYEFNKGVSILTSQQKYEEVFSLYENIIQSNKKVSNLQPILNVIINCYNTGVLLINCVEIVKLLFESGYQLNQSFWKSSIEGLIKLKKFNFANELIKIYPLQVN